MVNKDNGFQEVADVGFDFEFPQDPELRKLREKNRKKRLELLFGDPTLTVESVVTPIGEKEVEEEVKRLLEERESILNDKGSLAIGELDKEVKKSKAKFKEVMKEMGEMRKQQVGGIAEACENMETMCLDVGGYVKKVEQHIKELEEELESAQESQKKLREELQIAKNDEVKKSWSELRNGEGASSMASMMGKEGGSELKGSLKTNFVPAKN